MSATAVASSQLSNAALNDPAGATCDAVNGNVAVNTGRTGFRFVNSSTSATVTVTVVPAVEFHDDTLSDLVWTIPTAVTSPGGAWFGEVDPDVYGREMVFTASATSVKVTVFEP
jgi:hypothetical protein